MFGLLFGIFTLVFSKLLFVALIVLCVVIPKKKGYEYTKLDKIGVKTNIALGILYVGMSWLGICTLFFADSPSSHNTDLVNFLISIIISIGFSIPLLSIASIFTSIVARKRGKSKPSFVIQFVPIPVFVVMMCLILYTFSL